jgi:hypothetical protein
MQLIVPFAAPWSEAGRRAMQSLSLPRLDALLRLLGRRETDAGDEYSLSTPHERALARALGLAGADGTLPWAALAAAQAGIDASDLAWGLLTPVHLHLGTEQVTLLDPAALQLDAVTSRTLMEAVEPFFTSEGFAMRWLAPDAWLIAHETLADLPVASLDRVIGRNVDRWLPGSVQARLVRRLQNEVQMMFHTHPVNAGREACGQLTVNSVWLSGCGRQQATPSSPDVTTDGRLRTAALTEDWAAWSAAWSALDAGPIAELLDRVRGGTPATLTLCGERCAVTCSPSERAPWRRWFGGGAAGVGATLEAL